MRRRGSLALHFTVMEDVMRTVLLILACLATAWLAPAGYAAKSGKSFEQAFKAADKDSDGTLDREEAKALPRVAKRFDEIDADKDGTVSLEEVYASARKVVKHMEEERRAKFQAADKDKDGTLDREEAKALPRVSEHFDEIDADKDGTVSAKEINTYAKAKAQAKN